MAATLLVCLLSGLLTGCGARSSDQPPPGAVTIALLTDASASAAPEESDAARGARLAVEVVNGLFANISMPLAASPGLPALAGAALNLVVADTRGQSERAAGFATAVVESDGARAVIVSDSAEVAAAAGSQIQRVQVPLIDAGSTADYLTELGLDWYFRAGPSDRMLAETALSLLGRQQPRSEPARVALLAESGSETAAAAALMRGMATRDGHGIGYENIAMSTSVELDALAAEVGDARCNVILAPMNSAETAATALRIASRLSDPLPIIGLGPGFATLSEPPDGVPVVLRAVSWSAELAVRSSLGRAVTELYQRRFGVAMTSEAANTFTATMVLATAIDAAASADPTTIRGALRQLSIGATQMIMPWSGVRFDGDGQNVLAAAVVEGARSGPFQVIYPRELATGEMIWTAEGADPP